MSNITGVFNRQADANKTLMDLLDKGFSKHNISIVVSDEDKHIRSSFFREGLTIWQGGVAGALSGGMAGILIAILTIAGTIRIPHFELFLKGHTGAILSCAGMGLLAGGLIGLLIIAVFSVDASARYKEDIKAGKTVMAVHTTDEDAERTARRILLGNDAILNVA